MADRRQEIYNACLELARSDIKDEPGRKCQPGHWSAVGERAARGDDPSVPVVGGIKALVHLAYSDACKEAGHLSDLTEYSEWYAGAKQPKTAQITPRDAILLIVNKLWGMPGAEKQSVIAALWVGMQLEQAAPILAKAMREDVYSHPDFLGPLAVQVEQYLAWLHDLIRQTEGAATDD